MKGIVTVVGRDKVGIIAAICNYLSSEQLNILDISQTIVNGYFNMVMIVDMGTSESSFEKHSCSLQQIGEQVGVVIHLQHEDIFNCMHRI